LWRLLSRLAHAVDRWAEKVVSMHEINDSGPKSVFIKTERVEMQVEKEQNAE
jgi:hypothetical protein